MGRDGMERAVAWDELKEGRSNHVETTTEVHMKFNNVIHCSYFVSILYGQFMDLLRLLQLDTSLHHRLRRQKASCRYGT